MSTSHRAGVAVCTLVAALLRFPTLDAKSYWVDEVVTVTLVRLDLWSMLETIPNSESTPPLYYVVAWAWAQLAGVGEVGMRSLPALLGTVLVPVAYLAGRELVTRRAGVAAAALVAVNPLLVWYSQEARSYMLLVLLGGLSFLFFARSLRRPGPAELALWALASALALATHYFALFLVVSEAVWLVARLGRRRDLVFAVAGTAAAGALLLPLAVQQLENPRWIAESGLWVRLATIPASFLVGFEVPVPYAFAAAVAAAAFAGTGLWLLARRAAPAQRRGGRIAAGVGATAVVLPALLSPVGLDYVVYKNVIAALLPLTVAVAAGLVADHSGRLGAFALTGLLSLSAVLSLLSLWQPKYHREDWRRAAEAIVETRGPRAIVVTPADGALPLEWYLGASRLPARDRVRVREVTVVAGARRPLGSIAEPSTPRPPAHAAPVPTLEPVERLEARRFTLIRYRGPAPVSITAAGIRGMALDTGRAIVLVQRG